MNRYECDILNVLFSKPYTNQRELSIACGHSLGIINRSLKSLLYNDYINEKFQPTTKAQEEYSSKQPKNAIILAAGTGMRMVPINTQTPKALLEVKGERLIERIIKQLHDVGIHEIYVIVGFMKEMFEYLIDDYNVKLIVNQDYASKNNMHSLNLASKHLSNSYIIPCDIWCATNPFRKSELYSWYMVSDTVDQESNVRVTRNLELAITENFRDGNSMIGIAYLLDKESAFVREKIKTMSYNPLYDKSFWEEALYHKGKMITHANVVPASNVFEINTYEQLRDLDNNSNQLESDAISIITRTLNVSPKEISDITVLKKGMTNRSFLFTCHGKRYIMRIPGVGTDLLIDRTKEANVYHAIMSSNICDDVIYINPKNGYKITTFLENSRVCDPLNPSDITKCMRYLRSFHELNLQVRHEFNLFEHIDFYESLWEGIPSIYRDYKETKANVFSLKPFIETFSTPQVLTHIDAVPDNFLFVPQDDGTEYIRLIDWEYAGMQDPHVDIAMFCIYALYDRNQVDQLINAYFQEGCSTDIKLKIYCYIAICGLLWSNWCEYKRNLGVEFGEYSLQQYRYAKEYYRIVEKEINSRRNS